MALRGTGITQMTRKLFFLIIHQSGMNVNEVFAHFVQEVFLIPSNFVHYCHILRKNSVYSVLGSCSVSGSTKMRKLLRIQCSQRLCPSLFPLRHNFSIFLYSFEAKIAKRKPGSEKISEPDFLLCHEHFAGSRHTEKR